LALIRSSRLRDVGAESPGRSPLEVGSEGLPRSLIIARDPDKMTLRDSGRARLCPSRIGERLAGRLALPESGKGIQMPAVVKSPWPNDNGYRSHVRGESGCKCNTTALRGATRIGTGSVGLPVPVPSSSAAAGQELEHRARSRTMAATDCPDRAELEGFA